MGENDNVVISCISGSNKSTAAIEFGDYRISISAGNRQTYKIPRGVYQVKINIHKGYSFSLANVNSSYMRNVTIDSDRITTIEIGIGRTHNNIKIS